jgi:hypothetical protein
MFRLCSNFRSGHDSHSLIIPSIVVAKRGGKLVPRTPQKAKKAVVAAERTAGQYA